jgi:hypothetical protein
VTFFIYFTLHDFLRNVALKKCEPYMAIARGIRVKLFVAHLNANRATLWQMSPEVIPHPLAKGKKLWGPLDRFFRGTCITSPTTFAESFNTQYHPSPGKFAKLY